jgi:hypothetical protein
MQSTSNVQVTVFNVFRSVRDALHSDPAVKRDIPEHPCVSLCRKQLAARFDMRRPSVVRSVANNSPRALTCGAHRLEPPEPPAHLRSERGPNRPLRYATDTRP